MKIEDEGPELVYQGIAASPGLAHGPAFVFLHKELDVPIYGIDKQSHEIEKERFEAAIIKAREDICRVRTRVSETLSEREAKIFDAHLLVLEDRALIDETIQELKETSYNIDYCFYIVSKRYILAFESIDDEYIKERAMDIRDVAKRVLGNLLGENELSVLRFNEKKVIVSDDLPPSEAAEIQKDCILGLVTNKGSRTSHAVIMARSLQVPAVVGLRDITELIKNDSYLIVDGYDGVVIVNPRKETLERYTQIKSDRNNVQKVFESISSLPAQTKDGIPIPLLINVDGNQDLEKILNLSSDGIGLFRTESIFLRSDEVPSEEEQFDVYRKVVESMSFQIVTIRTLDLGGDKRVNTFFMSEHEMNPFMGFRAIRLCLEHIDIFKNQLRAILRASTYGKVRLMYPMISSPQELLQANEILEQAKDELRSKGIAFDEEMEIGSMIETPSAALTIDLLAEHCSFFSIGTNDLIQYVLAVDRINDRIAHLYQPNHPAVIRILKSIIDGAHSHGIEIGVCGEMAADPLYASMLLGMGVDSLSVTPGSLPEIKHLIRNITLKEAKEMTSKILKETEPYKILKILREFYLTQVGSLLE